MKGSGFDGRGGSFGGSQWDWDPVVKARLRHDQSGDDEEGGDEKAEAAAVHAKGEHCGGLEQIEQMPDARMELTLKALLLFCRAELLPFGISLYFHYERVGKTSYVHSYGSRSHQSRGASMTETGKTTSLK